MKKPGLLKDTCNIDEDCLKIGEQLVSLSPANRAALETNSSSDMAEQPRARMKEEALLRYDVSILFDLPSQGASIGSPTAPVKITVYQDLKCGMCKYAFQRVLPEIAGNYLATGKAHITFKEYPLIPRELEMKLAEAAKCAGEQGKYAAFVAEMYSDKTESSLEKIVDYAERASLDGAMFQACRDSGRAMASVESDISDGKKLAIEGTPMFFVNDTVIKGAQPFDRFKVAIDQELARTN